MERRNRIALLAGFALVLAATGTVLATRAPDVGREPSQLTDETETPPTAEELAHAADRLDAAGLEVDDALLSELASTYGLGGAVRLVAWSDATGEEIATLRQMRDGDGSDGSGMGWGQMARELGVHPGIGSIMGNGGGHGPDDAPGQTKKGGDDAADE